MSINISVRLSPQQVVFLEEMAREQETSVSMILRYLVMRYEATHGQVPQQDDYPVALRGYFDDVAHGALDRVRGTSSVSKSLRHIIDHYANNA